MSNNLDSLIKELSEKFGAKCILRENTVFAEVGREKYLGAARYLKENGFTRLLTISAVDWIEKGVFEVYFIAHRLKDSLYVKVSTSLDREKPVIESLGEIWENSLMHERECWEMFGIVFEWNNMLKPLLLEEWSGPPPFRKDFDSRKYVREVYGV